MTQAAKIATTYACEQSDKRISDKLRTIEDSGTEIISLSDETHSDMRRASENVYTDIKKQIAPEIYDSYMSAE